jgi:hypothetical protein
VVMSVDKDEATQRAERDREAAAKRMQNVLPAWHLKSTISGDLTALGIRENARAEQQAEADGNRLPSSNDVILRGLTKVEEPVRSVQEDVKPVITQVNDVDCAYSGTSDYDTYSCCHDRLRPVLRVVSCIVYPFRPRHPGPSAIRRVRRGRRQAFSRVS